MIELISKIIAVLAAIFAAIKFFIEYKRSNAQKAEELRWRKALLAREMLKELFDDPLARSALRMVDWEEREYTIPGQPHSFKITSADVAVGLRTFNLNFPPKEQYIRECFERLYDLLDAIEHFTHVDLLEFSDFRPPLAYYVALILERYDIHEPFLITYGYSLTQAFLKRFKADPASMLRQSTAQDSANSG